MTSITALIPVLDRPHRVEPLLASLRASERETPLHPLFLLSVGDQAEYAAVKASGAPFEYVGRVRDTGQYPRKMNHGYRLAVERGADWMFTGADDLDFQPGWAEEALAVAEQTGCCVIGTNDEVNSRVKAGRHSTHTLFHRDYLECGTIDEDGKLFHEGYGHWWSDDEAVRTAIFRDTFASASRSIVRHLHPNYGGAPDDATYRRGQASMMADKALFDERKWMWTR